MTVWIKNGIQNDNDILQLLHDIWIFGGGQKVGNQRRYVTGTRLITMDAVHQMYHSGQIIYFKIGIGINNFSAGSFYRVQPCQIRFRRDRVRN